MIRVTHPPAQLPVLLATVKEHLLLLETDLDAILTSLYIPAAVEEFQARTKTALISQQLLQTFDQFPRETYFLLERHPMIEFHKVEYYNTDEQWVELGIDVYRVHPETLPVVIELKKGKLWPSDIHATARGAVRLTYRAGYGTTHADVPVAAQQAICLLVGDLVLHREDTIAAPGLRVESAAWTSKVLMEQFKINFFEHPSQRRG